MPSGSSRYVSKIRILGYLRFQPQKKKKNRVHSHSFCFGHYEIHIKTERFDVTNGVRQGDSLSPTLFSIYLNDLATEIKDLNVGVPVADMCISLLLYADDIVLFAPDEEKLQSMLNVVDKWCRTWGMEINSKKTQILHVRNYQIPRSTYQFSCGDWLLNYTDTYKYLGYMIHEHLCETKNVEIMTACASRSFGRIHSIFKKMGNMGIKSYETLYKSYVDPVINYASGVWGFDYFNPPQVLQNRVMRFFLGIHKFAPNAATKIEMDWLGCREKRWLNMIRLYNRINVMPLSRLPKIIYDWDVNSGASSWSSEVRHIIHKLNLDPDLEWGEIYDLTAVNNKLLEMSRLSGNLE